MSSKDTILQNTENAIGIDELVERIHAGKKLRVKLGVDPTRPDLTFGHMVVLNKMRQFQDMGHECILLIGDYTATIGDPSGRSTTRPILSEAEVRANAETYLDQAFLVLDEQRTTVRYNSEWFGKMSFSDALALSRRMTVARMLERDDFSKRYNGGEPISIVEFLYPLVQGYDSIMLEADVELGGSDQLFNMLVGRQLQKDEGMTEQAVITMPLLVGLDGVRKMSKSFDNYIAFCHTPKEMFGKVMSISDETMWAYYKYLLLFDDEQIAAHKAEHPMVAKKNLASSLVGRFHSFAIARAELEEFENVFSRHELPNEMPEVQWKTLPGTQEDPSAVSLVEAMAASELFPSKKEIRRLIEQGAIKVDNETVTDTHATLQRGAETVVQAGKRKFFRIVE